MKGSSGTHESQGSGGRMMLGWRGVFREAPASALFATWLGAGFLPWVPGTWGSLAAIPFVALLYQLTGLVGIIAFVLVTSVFGVVAAGRVSRLRGVEDPSEIVIDEVAGQSLTLLGVYAFCPFPQTHPVFLGMLFLGFVLFRILDIWKPGPIGKAERLPGGWGVMADDLLAGLILCLLLAGGLILTFRR